MNENMDDAKVICHIGHLGKNRSFYTFREYSFLFVVAYLTKLMNKPVFNSLIKAMMGESLD